MTNSKRVNPAVSMASKYLKSMPRLVPRTDTTVQVVKLATKIAGVAAGVVAGVLASAAASAGCLDDDALRGVNLAGAEFNSKTLPGVMYKNYTYPKASEFDYFASKGANTIRLPVRWERVQRELFSPLDGAELAAITKALDEARKRDMCLLLDVHNYGMYHSQVIGSSEVPVAAFIDLWKKLASALNDPNHLALGLMNEPFKLDIPVWGNIAKRTLRELRDGGFNHLVMVSGGRWSGVHEWSKTIGESSNAETFATLDDPLDRAFLEVHQYTNPGYSGTSEECLEPAHFDQMFDSISHWARVNDQRLFLGEFGTAATESCLETLQHLLCLTSGVGVWKGWTYWAAGSWWGNYFMSISPRSGVDAPQMKVVEPFLNRECLMPPPIIKPQ